MLQCTSLSSVSEGIMKKESIAFKGNIFTIEWYFTSRGKSEALEYFEELSSDRQKKTMNLLK